MRYPIPAHAAQNMITRTAHAATLMAKFKLLLTRPLVRCEVSLCLAEVDDEERSEPLDRVGRVGGDRGDVVLPVEVVAGRLRSTSGHAARPGPAAQTRSRQMSVSGTVAISVSKPARRSRSILAPGPRKNGKRAVGCREAGQVHVGDVVPAEIDEVRPVHCRDRPVGIDSSRARAGTPGAAPEWRPRTAGVGAVWFFTAMLDEPLATQQRRRLDGERGVPHHRRRTTAATIAAAGASQVRGTAASRRRASAARTISHTRNTASPSLAGAMYRMNAPSAAKYSTNANTTMNAHVNAAGISTARRVGQQPVRGDGDDENTERDPEVRPGGHE